MNSVSKIVQIDGSVLEGGGQILRISVALSAILNIPININKIRANRSKPGLAAQHLTGIKLVGDMCGAKLRKVEIGSTEIEFVPTHKIKQGVYYADPRTAGSISLLIQVALPCALFSDGPVSLNLRGGTNVDMSPPIEYIDKVFRPNLKRFTTNDTLDLVINRRGYFPRGGGDVVLNIIPVTNLKAINLTNPGSLTDLHGWSYVAGNLPNHLADDMVKGAEAELKNLSGKKPNIRSYKESHQIASDNGSGIMIVGETSTGCIFGGNGLGNRRINPRTVGLNAAKEIIDPIKCGACVDSHMQDQLILFMAMAEGESEIRVSDITSHTNTAIYIIEKLTQAKFEIIPDGESNIIKCVGIGPIGKSLFT